MKGIRLTVVFSSLVLGLYADGYSDDSSDLLAAKGYFPETEATTPSSSDDDSNTSSQNPKKQKKWKPEAGDDTNNNPSLLQPKEAKQYFPVE